MNQVHMPGVLIALAASVALIGCGKKEEPKAAAPAAKKAVTPAAKPAVKKAAPAKKKAAPAA